MAGTARPGTSWSANVIAQTFAFLIGAVRGKIAFVQMTTNPGQPNPVVVSLTDLSGAHVPVSKAPPAPVGMGLPATDFSREIFTGRDWFGMVHVLPRTKLEFGSIITTSELDYEIYNAYTSQDIGLSSIANNAMPGIELPNLTVPSTVESQTSILDPTSTDNSGGVGLGTLVKLVVRALPSGLPLFDTTIDFNFASPAMDGMLLVSGQRVALAPFEYESPLIEKLAFATDVIGSVSGKEQNRVSIRKQPRQFFEPIFKLEGDDRRRMQLLLFDQIGQPFGLPLWHEQVLTTADVSAGSTTYPVEAADEVDFRVGGLAVVITNSTTFDVITIDAVTPTLITAADPSGNAYTAGSAVMPLRLCRMTSGVSGDLHSVSLETIKLSLMSCDGDTGALSGDVSPGFWSTYNGRVLFDDCNVMNGSTVSEQFERRVYELDGVTGQIADTSIWDRSKRMLTKGFSLRSRADLISFRKVLLGLVGRQKSFYIATFFEDLTVQADVLSGGDTIDIDSVDYVRFAREREPTNRFRVTFTDGTQLFRTVASSSTISGAVERLTLNETWPANRTVAEFERIEFIDLVRFDADEFTITHENAVWSRCSAPVRRVFDDD